MKMTRTTCLCQVLVKGIVRTHHEINGIHYNSKIHLNKSTKIPLRGKIWSTDKTRQRWAEYSWEH